MTAGRGGRDRVWLAVLAGAFLFGLAASWQRWGNLLIDTGREMNQPLRIAAGEALYADVRHIYGPLSPWLHAALFRVVDPSLTILYVDGSVTAALVLAIVYWLSRQIMRPAAAGAATLSVMYLCVFKPAGNYILPYSYNAVHGAALSLLALALLVDALRRPGTNVTGRFAAAGIVAGLAMLAKTESGLAALAAGMTAAVLASGGRVREGAVLLAAFAGPAAALAAGAYAAVAARAGWSTLLNDSWLLLYNVPPEIRHYNGWISGLNEPLHSVRRVLTAAAKLGILAALIAAISNMLAGRRAGGAHEPALSTSSTRLPTPYRAGAPDRTPGARRSDSTVAASAPAGGTHARQPWPPVRVLATALATAVVLTLTIGLDWDKGPYLAMPLLLTGLIVMLIYRLRTDAGSGPREAVLLTCAVFALASLARMVLHVRSGGAHASYLLPVSVVLFTYLWAGPFASRFASARAGRLAATIAVSLIAFDAAATALIQAYNYRTRQTVPVQTPRGTHVAAADLGQAWNEALAFIGRHTRPGDAVAVMPEGTSLTFLSGRRHPLREEITTPGFLGPEGEARAIARLEDARTRLILVTNRPTGEFGPRVFGRDYNQRLMQWIEAHYERCAMFGPMKDPKLQIGDRPFFVRAYCAP